ncbi:MAG: NADH-quinone oxidoreductase subunit G [Actinomycetes bacterium]
MSVEAKAAEIAKSDLISVFIDGIEVQVPKGTLAIRAAEMIGIDIPRFCDHPLLDPVGACRQCMVEVPDMGNGRGMPKPQASCTLEVAPNMQIRTQVSSPVADKAQKGMLEFLLINHPLDCPICDKGGECPLQNQSLSHGYAESRYEGVKRTFPKPVAISAQVLLDRERCVLCARCTRFSEQISGDPFIALVERGALQQVGVYEEHPYDSYFSGNVIQICPVGALTSADYRFQARPFDLVSTPTTCEICASGCQLRTDHRHYQVKRRLAGNAPEVNEEWNCDRGRFAFRAGQMGDRVTTPLVRDGAVLRPASWPEAVDAAVAGLRAAGSNVGVLTGGRLTLENAYGYSKFARTVLGTNNIDFRARQHTLEEGDFLAHVVAGRRVGEGVTYTDLENARKVICVAFEAEEESPIVFLRLRKAARKKKTAIVTVASHLSNGARKLGAHLVPSLPGSEAEVVSKLDADADTVLLVGERAAGALGTYTAVVELAARTGARVAWIPRRAGERGAVEAGCLPSLLPGGRPVSDAGARVDVQAVWGVDRLPSGPGLDAGAMLHAAASGDLGALVVAGVQPGDFADAELTRRGIEQAEFVLSLEARLSDVTERADVVLPIDLIEAQAGTFLNWEHREGRVNRVNREAASPMTDLRVLAMLADGLGHDLGVRTAKAAKAEYDELGPWEGGRPAAPSESFMVPDAQGQGLLLSSWRELIDGSAANDGAVALLATAKPLVARLGPATASGLGLASGDIVTVAAGGGSTRLPLVVEESMVEGAVWIPGNRDGVGLGELRVTAGETVTVTGGAS